MLRPPRNWGWKSLSARDIALRATRSSLERHQHQVTTGKEVAVAAVRCCRLRLPHRHLNRHYLKKRSLEHVTDMTDATVEQQGEPKKHREHPEGPQARDSSSSSSSSSSSESSTDTEMGLVDVCTILSEAEGSHLGGPITLDLTKWDFDKADCRNKCRKLVENSNHCC